MDNNKNVKVIYQKIKEKFEEKGYIDLNHKLVNTDEDLVQLAQIFRDPRYETFRIIYMKKNKIAGYESISTRTPNSVAIVKPDKQGRLNQERCINKMLSRISRLDADGYYLVHNHPSYNAKASKDDVRTTEFIAKKIPGFRGHAVVNHESYAWIDVDEYGEGYAENYIPIDKSKVNRMEKELDNKSIYDVQIKSREDFVSVVCNIKNSKDYSIAILTDSTGRVRTILDIPNRMLNENEEQLKGFFRNIARQNGAVRVFFATEDEKAYLRSINHVKAGTFKDALHYESRPNNKIAIYAFNEEYVDKELWDEDKNKKKKKLEKEKENKKKNKSRTKKVKENEEEYFKESENIKMHSNDNKNLKRDNKDLKSKNNEDSFYKENFNKDNEHSLEDRANNSKDTNKDNRKNLENNYKNKRYGNPDKFDKNQKGFKVTDIKVKEQLKKMSKDDSRFSLKEDIGYFTNETLRNKSPLFYVEENQDENTSLGKVRQGYIRGLYKVPGEDPILIQLKNNLEAKQALVGGLIEIAGIDEDTLIVCNEEGKIMNLPPNVLFDYDFIAGPMIILGDDYDNGDFKSLTKDQIRNCKRMLKDRSFSKDNLYNAGFKEKDLTFSGEFVEKVSKNIGERER